MADQVTMTWTDTTGTYSSTFAMDHPTLEDVKAAYSNMMPGTEPKEQSDQDFYDSMTERLVNQVMSYAQTYKQQQAMQLIPPIVISPVEPAPSGAKP